MLNLRVHVVDSKMQWNTHWITAKWTELTNGPQSVSLFLDTKCPSMNCDSLNSFINKTKQQETDEGMNNFETKTFEDLIELLWIVLTVHVTKHMHAVCTASIGVGFGCLFVHSEMRNTTQLQIKTAFNWNNVTMINEQTNGCVCDTFGFIFCSFYLPKSVVDVFTTDLHGMTMSNMSLNLLMRAYTIRFAGSLVRHYNGQGWQFDEMRVPMGYVSPFCLSHCVSLCEVIIDFGTNLLVTVFVHCNSGSAAAMSKEYD